MTNHPLLSKAEARALSKFEAGQRLRPFDVAERAEVLLSLRDKGFLFDLTPNDPDGRVWSPTHYQFEITRDGLDWLGKV